MVATESRTALRPAESVDLECEFNEDQTLLIRFWGIRDRSTGRWDLVGADALTLWVDLPGCKHVSWDLTESGSEVDSAAMLREAERHWHRAESALEEGYQRDQQVAAEAELGVI